MVAWPGVLYPVLRDFFLRQLDRAGLGHNTFTPPALELIVRAADGVLRKARNLCVGCLPKNHNLVLIGRPNLLAALDLTLQNQRRLLPLPLPPLRRNARHRQPTQQPRPLLLLQEKPQQHRPPDPRGLRLPRRRLPPRTPAHPTPNPTIPKENPIPTRSKIAARP